ncbi:unnamed protein product [Acanthoscelides obtectus]|uniref:Uncharacterized protein n=1 Tax=Acanthoscelides obtectus TaxID=200917 RepID=A0A9P0JWN6_ACAOB|nr:unnamed protein product [Acanthoscelides obtectus]CAK1625467.1 hypothetical protein AOBTE_LOCUS3177 [Acanthoscelides obtectus]
MSRLHCKLCRRLAYQLIKNNIHTLMWRHPEQMEVCVTTVDLALEHPPVSAAAPPPSYEPPVATYASLQSGAPATPPRQTTPIREEPPTPKAEPKRSSNPLDIANLTAKDPPNSRKRTAEGGAPKLWSPVDRIAEAEEPPRKRMLLAGEIDYSLPITTTYLKYMRSLGCRDEDAFRFDNKH